MTVSRHAPLNRLSLAHRALLSASELNDSHAAMRAHACGASSKRAQSGWTNCATCDRHLAHSHLQPSPASLSAFLEVRARRMSEQRSAFERRGQ
jgi:hypothetical protein